MSRSFTSKPTLLLAGSALGATAYARYLANKAPEDEATQKQIKALHWAIPGLTGAAVASSLRQKPPTRAQVLREGVQDARIRAVEAAAPIAALIGARAVSAAHAAGPALEKARDNAVPALEKARDAAVPAFERARDAAVPALERARDNAKPVLDKARDSAKPALERAKEALPV
ncbi:MAG: hypothetical protein JWO22_1587 [Frankiales bacterium]|nr:hypothetical protein [Frankiales bacterium]